MFDLTTHARENRFRIRNVNDGFAVPPVRRVPRGTTGAAGLERDDVIACRYGYVGDYGPGKVGWYLTSEKETAHMMSSKLPQLEALGGEVTQVGDFEAAGWAPEDRIDDVLKILEVVKLHPGNPNPTLEGLERHGAAQRRRDGGLDPRNRNRAVSRHSAS